MENSMIRCAMEQYGAIDEKCRIKVLGGYSEGINSGWLEVEVYFPRSRKPDAYWSLCVDLPRNMVDFGRSQFNPLKPGITWRDSRPYMSQEQIEEEMAEFRRRTRNI